MIKSVLFFLSILGWLQHGFVNADCDLHMNLGINTKLPPEPTIELYEMYNEIRGKYGFQLMDTTRLYTDMITIQGQCVLASVLHHVGGTFDLQFLGGGTATPWEAHKWFQCPATGTTTGTDCAASVDTRRYLAEEVEEEDHMEEEEEEVEGRKLGFLEVDEDHLDQNHRSLFCSGTCDPFCCGPPFYGSACTNCRRRRGRRNLREKEAPEQQQQQRRELFLTEAEIQTLVNTIEAELMAECATKNWQCVQCTNAHVEITCSSSA